MDRSARRTSDSAQEKLLGGAVPGHHIRCWSASVVLVHGAWADGSSWAKVIQRLAADGICVTAAPMPLTGQPHPETPRLSPDAHGFIWMPHSGFLAAFSQHASPRQTELCAATQRPIAVACIQEKAPRPAWKVKPFWYLVAEEDRMIDPTTPPLISAPEPVIEVILEAGRFAGQGPGK